MRKVGSMFKNSGWALAHFNLKLGRVSLKDTSRVDPTLLLFSGRPLSFFFISLFSLSHGSDQGHHGQGPCSLAGTMHRRRRSSLTTGGGGFWFGLLPLTLSLPFFSSFFLFSLTLSRTASTASPPPPLSQTHGSLSLSTSRSW
jgi:hypothetical protein